jgi:glycerol-3-phosphate dehydrogenase
VANALSARENGATVASHTRVIELLMKNGRATGALVRPQHDGDAREVRARVIVNATGVWENGFSSDERARRRRGSKGVHISVPRERVGNHDALTLISPVDGRVMFCLPAGPQAIIGTTDTWTSESPEKVHASVDDIDYLLSSANSYFPLARLTRDDVVSAWAGIRPLATAATTNPTMVSREHSIVTDSSGVINVTGGKLTTYRSMAAEIVDLVQRSLGQERRRAATDSTELPGANRAEEIARLQHEDESLATPLVEGLPYTGAHLVYGVKTEMAQTLSDLLIRRSHLAFETRDHGLSVAPRAAEIVAPLLGWSQETKSALVREYEQDVERMFAIS